LKIKTFFFGFVAFIIQSVFPLQAQNTEGDEFWLTFGRNGQIIPNFENLLILQIRIVGGSKQTEGNISFTHLGTNKKFTINPYEVYDCILDLEQQQAVYNTVMGKTDYSVHITTDNPVSVYAYNHYPSTNDDVTNVLPVNVLGNEYYHISYTPFMLQFMDAYAVVATKNNTQLYHNGDLAETLNAGQVYYRTSTTDMTGSVITSNNPVAFFAVHQSPKIPIGDASSNLMQQLAPVNTWGKKFFVPVSVFDKDIVRIIASQDGTEISQTGGTIRTGIPGAQESLILQARQFVELDITLSGKGCHIVSNKPIGVCSYFRGFVSLPILGTSPAQCWIPGLEQKKHIR